MSILRTIIEQFIGADDKDKKDGVSSEEDAGVLMGQQDWNYDEEASLSSRISSLPVIRLPLNRLSKAYHAFFPGKRRGIGDM